MSTLLSFHKSILEKTHDPATSELLLIARGLGLRRVTCKLLQIYDSPQNLVILVNASQDEASAIGEELGVMGCRKPGLRIVGFETGRKERWVPSLAPRMSLVFIFLVQARAIQKGWIDSGHVPNPDGGHADVGHSYSSHYRNLDPTC